MRSKCHGTTWDFYDLGEEEALIGIGIAFETKVKMFIRLVDRR